MSLPAVVKVPVVVEIFGAELVPDPVFPGEVLAGDPGMSVQAVWESPDKDQLRGIWEVRPRKVHVAIRRGRVLRRRIRTSDRGSRRR